MVWLMPLLPSFDLLCWNREAPNSEACFLFLFSLSFLLDPCDVCHLHGADVFLEFPLIELGGPLFLA